MKLFLKITAFLLFFLLFFSGNSFALSPETHLADEAQEQRARNLFLEVRCLVCEGQVIESSATEFSFEMRKLIRKKISEGKSDKEIKAELVAEFGEDILTSTDFGKNNFMLWLLPLLFAVFLLVKISKLFFGKGRDPEASSG